MPENRFKQLLNRYNWKPIPGCPGRFILSGGISRTSPEQLLESPADLSEEIFRSVPDPVLYCFFEGGGLISYRKAGGYIHTLCDSDGMDRKMKLLKSSRND